jgi:hypothetical protein
MLRPDEVRLASVNLLDFSGLAGGPAGQPCFFAPYDPDHSARIVTG